MHFWLHGTFAKFAMIGAIIGPILFPLYIRFIPSTYDNFLQFIIVIGGYITSFFSLVLLPIIVIIITKHSIVFVVMITAYWFIILIECKEH